METNQKKSLNANMKGKHSKWHGYRLRSGKKYDPNDSHFNPMHLPKGYPEDLLKGEWEEPEITVVEEKADGKTRTKYILRRKE